MARKSEPDAHQKLLRVMDYQLALSGLSRVAAELMPRERFLQHVTAVVSRVTHISRVKVMRYRPDEADLLMEAGVGWKPGLVGNATFTLDTSSPVGRGMQTAGPIMIENLPEDPDYRVPPTLAEHGIVSLVNVPIRMDGKVWGLLEVDSDVPRGFDDGDILFLTTAANIVGVSLLRMDTLAKVAEEEARRARERSFFDVVLREFKHRVKNNLQTLVAFLVLQRRQAASPDERDRIHGIMNRVHAIALAQDQLSFTESASEVEFGDYLRSLCSNIDPRHDGVAIEIEATAGVQLPLDRAVAAGLIVNELVTNAFKYAFGPGGSGLVRVTFTLSPEVGDATLVVEDNGKGMGPRREGGLGLQLVQSLAGQLDGRIGAEPVEKGTRMVLRFPLPAPV